MLEPSTMEWSPTPSDTSLPSSLERRTAMGLAIVLAALLLGVLGDALLRATPWGVNLVLWVGSLVAAVLALLARQRLRVSGEGGYLVLPVLFFAGCLAWRSSGVLVALGLLALAVALGLAGTYLMRGTLRRAGLTHYLAALLVTGIMTLFGPLRLLFSDIAWQDLPRTRWTSLTVAVLRGLVIAIPLVLLFGMLFGAADAVFEGLVRDLFDIDLARLISHLVLAALLAWVSAGFLRQLLLAPVDGDDAQGGFSPRSPGLLGPIEIAIVLGALNLLFLAFVAVQFRYFFGGAELVASSTSLTYAEYARRGFFELVTVAALVLPLLLAMHWLARADTVRQARLFQGLAGLLIALLFVIMLSAVQRMRLYQLEFGLTELRLYTSVFMVWLGIMFVWFVLTVLRNRRDRFIVGALVTGFGAIAFLHLLNPDALIVRTNVARGQSALPVHPFDSRYAVSLSADAVPQLLASLDEMTEADRCYVATRLLAQWSPGAEGEAVDWRTWNLSRQRARHAVALHADDLEDMAC